MTNIFEVLYFQVYPISNAQFALISHKMYEKCRPQLPRGEGALKVDIDSASLGFHYMYKCLRNVFELLSLCHENQRLQKKNIVVSSSIYIYYNLNL